MGDSCRIPRIARSSTVRLPSPVCLPPGHLSDVSDRYIEPTGATVAAQSERRLRAQVTPPKARRWHTSEGRAAQIHQQFMHSAPLTMGLPAAAPFPPRADIGNAFTDGAVAG